MTSSVLAQVLLFRHVLLSSHLGLNALPPSPTSDDRGDTGQLSATIATASPLDGHLPFTRHWSGQELSWRR